MLGNRLIEWGKLDARELGVRLREAMSRRAVELILTLTNMLEHFAYTPDFWVLEVERQILRLELSLENPVSLVPNDFGDSVSPTVQLRLVQEVLHCYGQLLTPWDSIFEVARQHGR